METTTRYLEAPHPKQGRMWVREQSDHALGPFARRLFLPLSNSPIPLDARLDYRVEPGVRFGRSSAAGISTRQRGVGRGVTPGTTFREMGVGESREALFGG